MEKPVQEHEDERNQVQEDKEDEEEELQHTNPNPPPSSICSPPPQTHHSPKPQSPPTPPPLYSPPQEQQRNADEKRSPFDPPTAADTVAEVTTKVGPPAAPQLPLYYSPPQEQQQQKADDKRPPFDPPAATDTVAEVNTKVGPPEAPQVNETRGPGGSGRRYSRPSLSILKRSRRERMLKRALLGFRVCGFVFSIVSFSVLAADKDRGWALDSFYRYKEFRYCLAVNVIGFVYSGFQAFDLVYQLTTGKRGLVRNLLRCYFDFSMDQVLTYLLMSASSSAAVRIDDWQSNWGKDEFPDMAKASVGLSFLAFLSLGLSSLISGYTLCSLKSM